MGKLPRRQILGVILAGIGLVAPNSHAGEYRAIGRYEKAARPVLKDATSLWSDYQAAVADASEVEASEIVRDLVSLTPHDRSLLWREIEGASRVLVATWTGWDGYVGQEGNDMVMGVDVWVTPFPQLRDFAADSGLTDASLELRLAQRLGLPPDAAKTYVVEMWVDPSDVFRPAPDPEVTDREAELDYPQSTRYVTVSASHENWIESLKGQSYGPDGYPWTRLGYTYDWGSADSPVGFSEFVVRQGAQVSVESVYSTAAYADLGNYSLERVCGDFLKYVEQARQDWLIPGLAVGVVYRDQILCASAFGSCDLAGTQPVNVDTLFQIGSVSKSFTSLLTAMLVDRGLLQWNTPLTDLAPEFAFRDSYTTGACLLEDTMAQHPGVPSHCVSMLGVFGLPQENLIAAYRFVEPAGVFRKDYSYQNGLFALAGEICAQALGKGYAQCIEQEIFTPLGMTASRVTVDEFLAITDRARTHAYVGLEIERGVREIVPDGFVPYFMVDKMRPAGSLSSSLSDMLRFLRMQMGNGTLEGHRLVSPENLSVTHSPQTMVVTPPADETTIYYCMGWVLTDAEPFSYLWHNGDTTVSHSCIGFLPEKDLGIVVLSNVGGQNLPDLLMHQFFAMASNQPEKDRSGQALEAQREWEPDPYDPPPSPEPSDTLEAYAGRFHNPACGYATVEIQEGSLTLKLESGDLLLHLDHWSGDVFYIADDLQVLVLDEETGLVHFEAGQDDEIEAMVIDFFEVDGLKRFEKTGPQTSMLKAY